MLRGGPLLVFARSACSWILFYCCGLIAGYIHSRGGLRFYFVRVGMAGKGGVFFGYAILILMCGCCVQLFPGLLLYCRGLIDGYLHYWVGNLLYCIIVEAGRDVSRL